MEIDTTVALCGSSKPHEAHDTGLYEPGKPRHHGYPPVRCPGKAETFWERPVPHHGEPADEVCAAIWTVAARCSDDSAQQSAFNNGAHYVIQHLREACAELIRLHEVNDRMAPWSDKAAFVAFNAQCTAAYKAAHDAIGQVIGDKAANALWLGPGEEVPE